MTRTEPQSQGWDAGHAAVSSSERRQIWILLILAVLLRLLLLILLSPGAFFYGGDGPHYVEQGWRIARNALSIPLTKSGPLYPLLLAGCWFLFPSASEPYTAGSILTVYLTSVRLLQIALSGAMVWMGYRLAYRLGAKHRAGMIAALGLGLNPAFVLAPYYVLTEPVFMASLTAAVFFYLRAIQAHSRADFVVAGALFALAGLTRPVAVLLPFVFLGHLLLNLKRRAWQRYALVFLGAFFLFVLPWMVYLYGTSGSPVPEGFGSNLWIGAAYEGEWQGTVTTYERSQQFGGERGDFTPEALRIIRSDPLGWLKLRTNNLAEAVLTPYVTSDLGGPSVKQAFGAWLREDGSLPGLWSIIRLPNFIPKLAIYALHFFALALGSVGLTFVWKRSRLAFSVAAPVLYLVVVHGALNARPRYLFPAEVFLWVLAGCGSVGLWDRLQSRRSRRRASAV